MLHISKTLLYMMIDVIIFDCYIKTNDNGIYKAKTTNIGCDQDEHESPISRVTVCRWSSPLLQSYIY